MSAVEELIAMGVDVGGATAAVDAMTDEEWAAERAWVYEQMRTGQTPQDAAMVARTVAASNRFIEEIGDPPERIVVHEAGHAVVAHALNWIVDFVEPKMPDGGAGALVWQRRLDHPTPQGLFRRFIEQVVVGVAGSVAEEIEFGLAVPFEAMELTDRAREEYGVPEHQIGALIGRCEDRARSILTERSTTVARLARAQAAWGRVEGDELAAILAA